MIFEPYDKPVGTSVSYTLPVANNGEGDPIYHGSIYWGIYVNQNKPYGHYIHIGPTVNNNVVIDYSYLDKKDIYKRDSVCFPMSGRDDLAYLSPPNQNIKYNVNYDPSKGLFTATTKDHLYPPISVPAPGKLTVADISSFGLANEHNPLVLYSSSR